MGWIHWHRTLPSLTILFKTHLFFHSFYLFCWGFFGGGRFTCLPCSYIWKTSKSHASIHDNSKDLRRVRFLMGLNSLNLKATVFYPGQSMTNKHVYRRTASELSRGCYWPVCPAFVVCAFLIHDFTEIHECIALNLL